MIVSHGLSHKGGQFLIGDTMYFFVVVGPVMDDSFLLRILLLGVQLTILVINKWQGVRIHPPEFLTPS